VRRSVRLLQPAHAPGQGPVGVEAGRVHCPSSPTARDERRHQLVAGQPPRTKRHDRGGEVGRRGHGLTAVRGAGATAAWPGGLGAAGASTRRSGSASGGSVGADAVVEACTGSTTIVRDGCDRLMSQGYAAPSGSCAARLGARQLRRRAHRRRLHGRAAEALMDKPFEEYDGGGARRMLDSPTKRKTDAQPYLI
jgi:hypothetical protein